MRSPDAAIEIAKIKGLSHNVTSVLSERQAMNSVKDDCVLLVKTIELNVCVARDLLKPS
jgi:hypothetical protein